MNRIQFVGGMFQGTPIASILSPTGRRTTVEASTRVGHLADMPGAAEILLG